MSDTAADSAAAGADAPAAGRSRKKLILLVATPVLALLLIAAGLYLAGFGHLLGLGHAHGEGEAAHAAAAAPKTPAFFDLPEMLVNITASGRRPGFMKLSISFELEDATDIPRLQAVLPRIIDNIQVYLRELRVEDLKGSAGLYRLREELLIRVNGAAAPARIRDVLFKEMLVQ